MKPSKLFCWSKSIVVGVLTIFVSVLAFLQGEEWIMRNPQWVAAIGTVLGIANIVLRFYTDRPIRVKPIRLK